MRKKSNLSYVLGLALIVVIGGGFSKAFTTSDRVFPVTDTASAISLPVIGQPDLVVLNNPSSVLPLGSLEKRSIASINFGSANAPDFDNMLRNYAEIGSFTYDTASSEFIEEYIRPYNTLIIQLPANLSSVSPLPNFINYLAKDREVILAGFGNPAQLRLFDGAAYPIVWNPETDALAAGVSAQVIFGGIAANGRLKENIGAKFPKGSGFSTVQTRLSYTSPEDAGVNPGHLERIDGIMQEAIASRATPGGVVMVVKDGKVIFNKGYGSHTYDAAQATEPTDIFDVASITKIASTTVAAMKLYDEGKLSLEAPIARYIPEASGTNKSGVAVKEAMLHEAGFVNINFHGKVKAADHSGDSSFLYPVKVADNYYLRGDFYREVMWPSMLRSPLATRGRYVYSDVSMYMMKEVIERQARQPLDEFTTDQFYKKLGMYRTAFNPLSRFSRDEIVPTERDTYFRKALLQGNVHDPGAALVPGGVSGHAGLFSTANDLAILNQMLLNGGTYGGERYLKAETIDLFTSRQSRVSHRGLGFDRYNPRSSSGYPSQLASSQTYGHTGYTGTCVWVDPKYNLIYIFLSNRVYPSASTRLNTMRIRPRIQDVVYEAIKKGVPVTSAQSN